jgi:hypothetical protein
MKVKGWPQWLVVSSGRVQVALLEKKENLKAG